MYFQIHDGMKEHPKIRRLCAILKDQRAWSYAVALWYWCMKYAKDGDLRAFPVGEVETSCDWAGPDGGLIAALVACRLVDEVEGGHVVHDWTEWGGRYFEKAAEDAARQRQHRAVIRQASHGRPRDGADRPRDGATIEQSRTEQSRTEQTPDSLEPPAASKPVMTFGVVGKSREWVLTESNATGLGEAFPGLDVLGEARKAKVWLGANPTKRKTARGMPRFLYGWMERSQNKTGGVAPALTGSRRCDWHRRPGTNEKPSKSPVATCPECKHVGAMLRAREGTPRSSDEIMREIMGEG